MRTCLENVSPADNKTSAAPSPSVKLPVDPTTFNKTPSLLLKSAAPSVKEFVPPAPRPTDPYPGYYQKPDGEWAAHDTTYYWSVAKAWLPAEEPAPPSKKRKEWEGDGEDLQQISALDEASKTRAEIEDSKSLTANVIRAGPSAPNMTMTVRRSSPSITMSLNANSCRRREHHTGQRRDINCRLCSRMRILVVLSLKTSLRW